MINDLLILRDTPSSTLLWFLRHRPSEARVTIQARVETVCVRVCDFAQRTVHLALTHLLTVLLHFQRAKREEEPAEVGETSEWEVSQTRGEPDSLGDGPIRYGQRSFRRMNILWGSSNYKRTSHDGGI